MKGALLFSCLLVAYMVLIVFAAGMAYKKQQVLGQRVKILEERVINLESKQEEQGAWIMRVPEPQPKLLHI